MPLPCRRRPAAMTRSNAGDETGLSMQYLPAQNSIHPSAREVRLRKSRGSGLTLLDRDLAPASSSSFLSFSASSLEMPSLTLAGTASTRSLASLRPRLVAARTTLMTPIFLVAVTFENHVELGLLGRGRGGRAGRRGAAIITAPPAAGLMPWTSSR